MARGLKAGFLVCLFLVAYVCQVAVFRALKSPAVSLASPMKPAARVKTLAKPAKIAARVPVPNAGSKRTKSDLQNGQALSDAEIKSYLERTANGSYLLPYYKDVGKACRRWNVNPKLLIGMFQMECNLGKRMIPAPKTGKLQTASGKSNNFGNLRRNPGNFKPSGTPPIGYITVSGGPHAIFRTPADGINAYCWTLRHIYLDRGRTTLPKIISVYAPKSDGNNPDKYVKVVGRYLTRPTAK